MSRLNFIRRHLVFVIIILLSTACIILTSCKKVANDSPNPANNQPPIANAGGDQTFALPVDGTVLNGSLSSDPDGTIVSYQWAKISGPSSFAIINAKSVQTKVNSLIQGMYQFELKVTDNGGLSTKDTVQIRVNAPISPCDVANRTVVNARLIPIGNLSQAREGIAIASAGSKILFAGGFIEYNLFSTVDIYDVITQKWSTAFLSVPRFAIAVATAGNKIFFAGGANGDDFNPITYATVDIYDASTNTWSVTSMSASAGGRAAAVLNNKIFFAGGFHYNGGLGARADLPTTVDIYNTQTASWSTSALSEGRFGLSAAAAAGKVYFAGGVSANNYSTNKIDIYDESNGTWSASTLARARDNMACVSADNKMFWAGGWITRNSYNYSIVNDVEIRDVNTQTSTFACLSQPNAAFNAVIKDNKVVFFTSGDGIVNEKNKFDIYDITTNTWSIGVLNKSIQGTSIISVNNTIYVAGGFVNGVLSNQVWKLEF